MHSDNGEIPQPAGPARQDAGPRQGRKNRQARVGILPNPNRAALPPPHRPPLMGRFPRLRSSRRPPPGMDDGGELALTGADPAFAVGGAPGASAESDGDLGLVLDPDGRIARIDVDRLIDSVRDRALPRTRRAGYADHLLGDDGRALKTAMMKDTATARKPPPAPAEPPSAGAPPPAPQAGAHDADGAPQRPGVWARLTAPFRNR